MTTKILKENKNGFSDRLPDVQKNLFLHNSKSRYSTDEPTNGSTITPFFHSEGLIQKIERDHDKISE